MLNIRIRIKTYFFTEKIQKNSQLKNTSLCRWLLRRNSFNILIVALRSGTWLPRCPVSPGKNAFWQISQEYDGPQQPCLELPLPSKQKVRFRLVHWIKHSCPLCLTFATLRKATLSPIINRMDATVLIWPPIREMRQSDKDITIRYFF